MVLVQQGLVYHNLEGDTTMYEANHDTAYGLARSGKIIEAVQSRYGNAAKDVVQTLLLLGHTKVLDLERHYNSKIMDITNGNGYANGLDDAEGMWIIPLQIFTSLGANLKHYISYQRLRALVSSRRTSSRSLSS